MIIEFTVGNYRSIAEPQTLSMVAADIASENDNGIIDAGDMKLLRVAAIYGANASGKSNVWRAFKEFRDLTVFSAPAYQQGVELPIEPFLLRQGLEDKSSFFQIVFSLNDEIYRYGYEISKKRIESEWLFVKTSSRETRLFTREFQNIKVGRGFLEGQNLSEYTRDNALFLSLVALFNGRITKQIFEYLSDIVIQDDFKYGTALTSLQLHNSSWKNEISNFLKNTDLTLNKIQLDGVITKDQFPYKPNWSFDDITVKYFLPVHDSEGVITGERELDLNQHASAGTRKVYESSGSILQTINKGGALIVDELDAQLHPLMTRAIINLFNSPKTNPNNAQLIFNTHDTNLLKPDLLRRDQIWFTEKDRFGATHLYSLAEFRQEDGTLPRKDADFEEHYIQGRYGAIPYLGDFSDLITPKAPEQKETKPKTAAAPKKATKSKTVKPAAKKTARKKAVKNG